MRRRSGLALLVGTVLLVFPHLPFVPYSVVGVSVQAAQLTIVTVSLVMLTGWVGQISLGHAALVGVGAYATGWATGGWHLPFPFSTLVAGVCAAVLAAGLGAVALRIRGLYLAVASLIFSWMTDAFLFRIPWVVRHNLIEVDVIGDADGVPRFDLGNRTTMFYVAWGVALSALLVAANVRDARTGRAWFAIRGSEIGAASLGIDVTRYKLLAFVVSGFLAGVSGNLIMLDSRSLSPDQFQFTFSLFYLAVLVVGGISSLGGGLASSLVFAGLNEVFFRVRALGDALDLVSAALLAAVLLAYPGGLGALPETVRSLRRRLPSRVDDALLRLGSRLRVGVSRMRARVDRIPRPAWVVRADVADEEMPPATGEPVDPDVVVPSTPVAAPDDREAAEVVLGATGITVQFGGLRAVGDASMKVCRHEIVGLIGPNGAGKTTLFNAIAGLNSPTSGTITLWDQDVTALPVHRRAQLGVARTFQAIQLFPQLDVFANLLVATHVHHGNGFIRDAFGADSALAGERAARTRVAEVVEQLGLADVAHRRVADLPFGVLRIVEVARTLVTGFDLVMLDEPASGLDNTETDRLAELLRDLRDRGKTLLLIEHDVRMVTSVCDYIYVINRGEIIAEGRSADIQRDPAVVAAYLGEMPDDVAVPVAAAR